MSVTTALTEFVRNDLAQGRVAEIHPDDDLLSTGLIDSLGILQLVMFVEEQLSVKVPDEDVVLEHFRSISALTAYLESRTTA
jgi:acyl carrier protein